MNRRISAPQAARPQGPQPLAPSWRIRRTALIVASALFMQNLDSTVVATALPAMAQAFHADPVQMNVALTAYLISLAMFIPASGWIADRFGSRRVFRAAIVIFTLGSIACGVAQSLAFLVLARVLQGAGGAMMIPVGRLVLLRSVTKSELVVAMTWLTVPALIGPVLGPPVGGFIVTYTSWRWIFGINVPIGLIGAIAVTLFIDEEQPERIAPFDFAGLAYAGVAFSALMFVVETSERGVIAKADMAAIAGAGFVAALAYVFHARRHPAPLLDFSLIRIPTFRVSVISGSFFRIGVGAMPFLLPMMLQLGFGYSAAASGTVTFASAVGALVMRPVAAPLLRRFGFRNTLAWNAAASALSLGACALFRPSWPGTAIAAVLLVGGFFRSLQFTAYNTIAYADIPPARMSAATSLYSVLQQASLTLGIAAGAAALEAATHLSGQRHPATINFAVAFLVVAAVSLLAAPASLELPEGAGAELAGRS